MASIIAPAIEPDRVVSFEINPGTLLQFLETRSEGGPRLKCFEGSVTLVSPGMPHEEFANRLDRLILAICLELRIKHKALASTTWTLPLGAKDTAYEADKAFYIQSYGTINSWQPPDLAIEVVVSHPAKKALLAGALLEIPEMWVIDVPKQRLTFYHLGVSGKRKGVYRAEATSRAFPGLLSAEVLDRIQDPEGDDTAFHENCRKWARRVLVPRRQAANKGG
jgi:Uma2 family endonuclease